jgi:hypothetical protein
LGSQGTRIIMRKKYRRKGKEKNNRENIDIWNSKRWWNYICRFQGQDRIVYNDLVVWLLRNMQYCLYIPCVSNRICKDKKKKRGGI